MTTDLSGTLPPGNGEHILFVDDEPTICSLARTFLERSGYRITTHTNPEKALTQFRSDPDQFALVVTNLIMPQLTGLQLVRMISDLRPHLPIIMVTGFSAGWTMAKLHEFGICDLIAKPMTLTTLAAAVRRALTTAFNQRSESC
jgi:DNA-binding NtrC family response regulator